MDPWGSFRIRGVLSGIGGFFQNGCSQFPWGSFRNWRVLSERLQAIPVGFWVPSGSLQTAPWGSFRSLNFYTSARGPTPVHSPSAVSVGPTKLSPAAQSSVGLRTAQMGRGVLSLRSLLINNAVRDIFLRVIRPPTRQSQEIH